MKKALNLVLVAVLVLGIFASSALDADMKVGTVEWAAHGNKCFTIAFVVLMVIQSSVHTSIIINSCLC